MKNKFIILAACAMIATVSLTACGNNEAVSSAEQSEASADTESESTESEDVVAENPFLKEGSHDATEKENSFEADLEKALDADKGSLKTLSGKYSPENSKNTIYVFADDTLSVIESGTYEFTENGIKLQYGSNSELEYNIIETDDGFTLSANDNVILLAVKYMSGTDGLTGTEAFDGVYSMGDTQGFVFHKDGTVDSISTQYAKIEDGSWKQKTADMGEYQFEEKDGKMEITTNGTHIMTLVPVE